MYNDYIRELIYLFKEMDTYGGNIFRDLEQNIGNQSALYFKNQSDILINQLTIPEYLETVEIKIKEEIKRLEIIFGEDNNYIKYSLDELLRNRCNRIFEDVKLIENMIIQKDINSKNE